MREEEEAHLLPQLAKPTSRRLRWVPLILLTGFAVMLSWAPQAPVDSWSEQARILQKLIEFQKVRALTNLTQEGVDALATLPPLGPDFWRQRELDMWVRKLGFSTSLSHGKLTIDREDSEDIYIRVSKCWTDASLVSLKLMAALLSLEAAIHVCTLPPADTAAVDAEAAPGQTTWAGQRLLSAFAALRRLAFGVHAASIELTDEQEIRMACSVQINGIISSFLAVSQYISDANVACPAPQDVKNADDARCSTGISVLTSGLTKSSSALSDIAVQCADPFTQAYAKPVKAGREMVNLAACLNNVGQATAYVAKAGFALNDVATQPGKCPKYPTQYQRYECTKNIGALLADLGQIATYLSGAASGCGEILVPFACTSRIAGTITGLFDVVEGVGTSALYCNYPGAIKQNISGQISNLRQQVHEAKYVHKVHLN
ncbi:unnamed protein product [Effrenium voratum]|nr:unnamed protein product [Effrenium voratum]